MKEMQIKRISSLCIRPWAEGSKLKVKKFYIVKNKLKIPLPPQKVVKWPFFARFVPWVEDSMEEGATIVETMHMTMDIAYPYLGLKIVGKRGQLNAKLSERSKTEALVVAGVKKSLINIIDSLNE